MTVYLAILDDGHGPDTPGKRTPYIPELKRQIRENEFNKPVVNMLAEDLRRAGVHVFQTAPGDDDVSLKARTDFSNKIYWQFCDKYGKANVRAVFISVHYNAFDGKFDGNDPSGHSLHIYPNSVEGKKLADNVAKYLKGGTVQRWRGVKENNFHVLRETIGYPALLSENGFMDNKSEALLMLNKSFQQEAAEEHAKGILDYFGLKYVPKLAPSPRGTFYRVVTGSFNSKENAHDRVDKLDQAGFDSFLDAYKNNNQVFYRVITGSFSNKDNADQRVAQLKKKGFDSFIAVYKK
jgi:N-acetylmuramoyl-L-alanine amidase